MRAKRGFLCFRKLRVGHSFKRCHFSERSHRSYQICNTNNYLLLAKKSSTIEEPFFIQFLKIAKKLTSRNSVFNKSISLNLKFTSKPNGIRMGKGKGKIKHNFSIVSKNQSLISLSEMNDKDLFSVFKKLKGRCSSKLSLTFSKATF